MSVRVGLFAVAVAMLVVALVGCGGGGGGGDITPVPPGVTMTFFADTLGSGTRSVASRAPSITATLDDGATVVAYDYSTGAEVAKGTLAGGKCSLKITPGLTIVVVITGTKAGKHYRLSTIIPSVPVADKDFVADPSSTIAAEAIATKHPVGAGTVLDDATFDKVLAKATEHVLASLVADYSLEGGLIGGTGFGKPDSIDTSKVPDVIVEVPAVIDAKLVLAKNAVQQIKEAGVPLVTMTQQEVPDAQGIFTTEVLDKYTAFVAGLNESMIGKMVIIDHSTRPILAGHGINFEDVPLGHTYSGVVTDGRLVLTDTGAGPAGRYTVTVHGALTRTFVAAKSGRQWTITETVSDSSEEYSASFPMFSEGEDPGANPSYTGTISLKNAAFPTAVTFHGTASGTGAGLASYTQMVFDGTLTAPNFSFGGRFEGNFPASKPAGAKSSKTIYDFATSASITGGNISVTNGAGTTIALTGDITANFTVGTSDGYAEIFLTHFVLSGKYSNSHSGLGFDGSITANWTNPGDGSELTAIGDVTLHGELTRTGYSKYYEDIKVNLNTGAVTSTIDLRAGSNTLTGTASGTLVLGDVAYGTMTLTNQDGVQFSLGVNSSYVLSGSIKAGSALTTVATISQVGDRIRIAYTDGTFEEF